LARSVRTSTSAAVPPRRDSSWARRFRCSSVAWGEDVRTDGSRMTIGPRSRFRTATYTTRKPARKPANSRGIEDLVITRIISCARLPWDAGEGRAITETSGTSVTPLVESMTRTYNRQYAMGDWKSPGPESVTGRYRRFTPQVTVGLTGFNRQHPFFRGKQEIWTCVRLYLLWPSA